ncbi:MAG: hypothetical protein FP816_18340 [Desulfobacteraceae bacterium]|nr:hypothetical protein [Desulfobacteraceae bacterium]MBU4001767.1 hypothetical protein [Pseudomonadota bacterium]MBU4054430.1 hypothetical protein [Pseudomonadota bacterium]
MIHKNSIASQTLTKEKEEKMLKSRKFFVVGLVLMMAAGLVLGIQGNVCAQDAKLVKIHGVGGDTLKGFFIDPEVTYAKKNTIIVWLDGVAQQDIKIEFADGKKCKSVTAYQSDFNLVDLDKERWCYVTSWVSFAGTSSLQFTEVGEYSYKVISKDEKVIATGKLIVE